MAAVCLARRDVRQRGRVAAASRVAKPTRATATSAARRRDPACSRRLSCASHAASAAMTERVLLLAGAAIFAVLGSLHLAYTFVGTRLHPRDPAAIAAMQGTTLRLARTTPVWRAWIGFNASHSLGAIVFAAFVIGLAGWRMDVFRDLPAFAWLAVANSLAWLVLAWRYWFRIPVAGLLVASACFLAAAVRLS
jgi:hypothetical protein